MTQVETFRNYKIVLGAQFGGRLPNFQFCKEMVASLNPYPSLFPGARRVLYETPNSVSWSNTVTSLFIYGHTK